MRRRLTPSLLASLTPVLLLAGCTTEPTTGPRIVSLALVSGVGQSGLVGANLTQPLVVRAQDQGGIPVSGAVVTWTVIAGEGTATPSQSVTGVDGLASTTFRLGAATGQHRIRAALGQASPIEFTATAAAAPVSQLTVVTGDNQTAVVRTQLPTRLTVKASDAFGNARGGVAVTFTAAAGSGSVGVGTAFTDSTGQASTEWTLGQAAGTQRVTVSAGGIPAVTFLATATAGPAATLTIVSGTNQSAAPGGRLADSLAVRVQDAFGNAVKDAVVTWQAATDAGTVSPRSSKTDATGRAATSWTLGSTGGPKEATAAVQGLPSVTFNAAGSIVFASVMTGGRHACGLDEGGVAYCWGFNGDGQLGTGEVAAGSGPVFAIKAPTAVAGGLTFGGLSGGPYHTCGTTLSFNPYCWGKNVDGRLGDGGTTAQSSPTHVAGTNIFRQLTAGAAHTCGLTTGGRLFCWGSNLEGQVGIAPALPVPADLAMVESPVALFPATTFGAVAAGGLHSCALSIGGTAWCWGNNRYGQLGDSTTVGAPLPVRVADSLGFVSITTGDRHSCALRADGTAWCWGDNASGQLGTGSAGPASIAPVAVSGGLQFAALSAGQDHTCGLTSGGIAYCWGGNTNGQLGTGTTAASATPTPVGGGRSFRMLSAGAQLTCGTTTGNVAYCWGDNQYGQVGDGTQVRRTLPTKVAYQP